MPEISYCSLRVASNVCLMALLLLSCIGLHCCVVCFHDKINLFRKRVVILKNLEPISKLHTLLPVMVSAQRNETETKLGENCYVSAKTKPANREKF